MLPGVLRLMRNMNVLQVRDKSHHMLHTIGILSSLLSHPLFLRRGIRTRGTLWQTAL